MGSVAALVAWINGSDQQQTIASIATCELIKAKALAGFPRTTAAPSGFAEIAVSSLWSKQAVLDSMEWFRKTGADHLLCIGPGAPLVNAEGLRRMVNCLDDTGCSIAYGDYFDLQPDGSVRPHPLIDYQPGSLRDTFTFGPVMAINGTGVRGLQKVIEATAPDMVFGGMYDLRLRLSEQGPVCHLPEPLYHCVPEEKPGANSHFAYVDPRNRDYQLEMEKIATLHLRRIGALVDGPGKEPSEEGGAFPVTASVVIPVKNRSRTIGDAVKSALSQKTSFSYNVIVVDNHSNDGTADILERMARDDARLIHRVPQRKDLLIGGCWNEAVYSASCGTYAVQLDSDDLYNGADVLQRIVDTFAERPCVLVIGSYTTVAIDGSPLAPGLVDHCEWTDANGPNNALRIAGLGAPRAYHVPTLRKFGFPNVSYGEDYAVVLRLCRSYAIGRIYDSLYWCRRWEENSDSSLSLETANRYDFYKDRLRSIELAARMHQGTRP